MPHKTCCIIGSANLTPEQEGLAYMAITSSVNLAVAAGYSRFLCSFCGDSDFIFAMAVLRAQRSHPQIFLTAILPYETLLKKYAFRLEDILPACKNIICLEPTYRRGYCLSLARTYIQQSDHTIVVNDGKKHGTSSYAISYAHIYKKSILWMSF